MPPDHELRALYKAFKVAGNHFDTWLVETIYPVFTTTDESTDNGTALPKYITRLKEDCGKGEYIP